MPAEIRVRSRGLRSWTHRDPRRSGMTLVEVMIVVVILAMTATGIQYSFGALTRMRLRSACVRVIAASRYAYNRAVSRGTVVRVLFDADKQRLSIQEAEGPIAVQRREEAKEDSGEAAVDPWERARQNLQKQLTPNLKAPSPFSNVSNQKGEVLEHTQERKLGDGIRIAKMLLPHEPGARTSGQGAIYFFPGGRAEHAVIQLQDRSGTVFSVEILPATGRGRVHTRPYEAKSEAEILDPG